MSDKTIAVDFDGVISDYRGWKGKGNFAPPINGASEFLGQLRKEKWKIIIHTTRSETDKIAEFLNENKIPYDHINFNPDNVKFGLSYGKPLADVYLDDRAIRFRGEWDYDLMVRIKESAPHWRTKKDSNLPQGELF
jgi:hypothetical protein